MTLLRSWCLYLICKHQVDINIFLRKNDYALLSIYIYKYLYLAEIKNRLMFIFDIFLRKNDSIKTWLYPKIFNECLLRFNYDTTLDVPINIFLWSLSLYPIKDTLILHYSCFGIKPTSYLHFYLEDISTKFGS